MSKSTIKFKKFEKALASLAAIYLNPIQADRSTIDATIQRFEFTIELSWQFLKDYFFENGLDIAYPKAIFQAAFSANLIDNEEIWLQMLTDRNLTSHTYNEKLADEIYFRIRNYVPEFQRLRDHLKPKFS